MEKLPTDDNANVAVATTDGEVAKKEEEKAITATYKQLFSTADWIDWSLMIFGTLAAFVTGGCFPFINVLFGRMIDGLNGDPSNITNSIGTLAIDFCYVALAQMVSSTIQVACWSCAGERQTQKIREKYVRAILRQEIGFFDLTAASQLSTKVTEYSGTLQDGITRRASEIFQYGAQFLGSYAVGLYLSWKLALVLCCALPLIGGAGAFMALAITNAQNTVAENYAAAGGLATESLSAIRTVSALNLQAEFISKYRVYLSQAMQMGIKKGLQVGLGNGAVFFAFFLTYALGFWYGGSLVADSMDHFCYVGDDCMTGGKVIAVFFSIVMGSFSIGQAAPPMQAFFAAKAAVAPMMEVIERDPLIDGLATSGKVPEGKCQGAIELRDVVFAYPARPLINACNHYSLVINSGETVALCGASGSGKSTIINLLLRFYDPQQGSILLDGMNIRELNLRWLRSVIGFVGQEPVLFAGTIFDNIAYGLDSVLVEPGKVTRDDALREKVIAAAKLANAHNFIMNFPNGYDTDVGSNGASMSGGQKQRIAIARALIKKPAVLLLDEATSALDATSEKMVQESIDELQKQKAQTTLIIAHRLSTIRNADKIAVVREGSVVELGKHDDLLSRNGIYAELIKLQVEDRELESGDDADADAAVQESDVVAVVAGSDTRSRGNSMSRPRGDSVSRNRRSDSGAESLASRKSSFDKGGSETPVVAGSDGAAAGTSKKPKEGEAIPGYEVKDKKTVNNKTWALVMKHWQWLCVTLLGGGIFGAIFPVLGLLLSYALQAFFYPTGDEIRTHCNAVAVYYLIAASGAVLGGVLLYFGAAQLSERVSMRLRSAMFEALLRREIAFFDDENNAIGALTARLSNDSRYVAKASGELFAKCLQAGFCVAIGMGIGLASSWKLSLVVIATFPINALAGIVQQQTQMGLGRKKTTEGDSGEEGAIIATAFTNMRTVSAFSMHFKVMEEYSSITWKDSTRRLRVQALGGVSIGVANGLTFTVYALLFWYGSTLIKHGEIVFEDMMRAMFCIMFGAMGLGAAFADVGDQKLGLQAAERIYDAMEQANASPIDGLSKSGIVLEKRSMGSIELRNVHFHYPSRPDVKVCDGYNLKIESGEVVAFVGPSGSGKSTIMNLLLRFYDPLEGQVLLDDVDIKSINIQSLRSQIGYVGQEPVLFNLTVGDNISKGRAGTHFDLMSVEEAIKESDREIWRHFVQSLSCKSNAAQATTATATPTAVAEVSTAEAVDASKTGEGYAAVETNADIEMANLNKSSSQGALPDHDIIVAAQEANAHQFISQFSQGYATEVGERSVMVSGGQKQRIAIARALIKKPAVLLLDEATSALDATSEKMVQESIDELQKQKAQTIIVIAHRLTTIKNADRIVVIDQGKIVQTGTHDNLVQDKTGLYYTLWEKQQGREA